MDKKFNRRNFCQSALLSSTSLLLPNYLTERGILQNTPKMQGGDGPEIIDTNVYLFDYPFRNLKYSETNDLAGKLIHHKITKAWAGSFEHLFHKNMDLANQKLLKECTHKGNGMFKPVGSVNLSWPDWEEDLRRCRELYDMNIVRVFPIYQMVDLGGETFDKFLQLATKYNMLVQIVGDMEDRRHHHPLFQMRDIDFTPLIEVGKKYSSSKIQLVHWNRRVRGELLDNIVTQTNIRFDTSRIEGAGELGGLLHSESWYGPDFDISASRFLFGSHAPYFAVESALLKMFEHPLSKKEFDMIARENANAII